MTFDMIDRAFADSFAKEWIEGWNRRDIEAVMLHYDDDFEMSSPYIVQVTGEPSGTLKGKESVRAYWTKALAGYPNLHFELIETLVGVGSIVLYYKGVGGRAVAEVFHFNTQGKVVRSYANYS